MVNNKSVLGLLLASLLVVLPGLLLADSDFGVRGLNFNKRDPMNQACQRAQDAGIGWHRGAILWQDIVDDQGLFDWTALDKQVKRTLNHQIQILFTLRSVHRVFAPGSGRVNFGYQKGWRSAPPAPEYLPDYEEFVSQVVERYDGDGFLDADFVTGEKCIKYWQVENEPGKKPEKGSKFWKGTAADYAALFTVARDVIKSADPDAKVALAGFTWEAMKYYLRNGTSFPYVVLQILGQSGVDFDIFDYHFYEDYRRFKKIDGLIHSHLSADVAYDTKPTWVTETNVDKNQMNPYETEAAYNRFVAKDITKRYCTLLHNGVEKAFWFKLADDKTAIWNVPMEPDDFCRFRGLTASDFAPKPVYYTYKLLIEKTDGKERVKKEGLPTDSDIWIYRFGRNDKAVYILWHDSDSGEPVGALIPLPWDEVLITHVITEPGITEPVTETRLTVNGFLEITLDDSPVFVEKHQTTE